MASTINATTSGIVTIGDSVATLSLQTGGNTAVAIDTAQIVSLSKSLALLGSTSGSVTISSPAVAGTQSYTLPSALPTASGQVLSATTAGVMSWAAAGGGSAATPSALGTVYGSTGASSNAFFGYQAGLSFSSGSDNTALGYRSLYSANTGSSNTAIGSSAGYFNTSGSGNIFVGQYAGFNNTTGSRNSFVGGPDATAYGAGHDNQTGSFNTGIGTAALAKNTVSNNTGVGYQAGYNITTGANNLCLGYVAGTDAVRNITTGSNEIVVGNNSNTAAYIKIAWTVTSDARDKTSFASVPHGLNFINSLTPTAYQFRESREEDIPTGPIRYGFLAQDILAAEGQTPVIIDNSDPENLKYNADSMVAVLVNAIKQLSAALDAANARIAALEAK